MRDIAHAYFFNAQKMMHCSFQGSQQGELNKSYFEYTEEIQQQNELLLQGMVFYYIMTGITTSRCYKPFNGSIS